MEGLCQLCPARRPALLAGAQRASLASLFLSVGSRVLFGLLIGLLYAWARRMRHPYFWMGLVSYLGRSIHSFLVYSTMAICFPEAGYGPSAVFANVFTVSNLAMDGGSVLVVLLLWRASHTRAWVQFQQRLAISQSLQSGERYRRLSLAVITLFTLAAALAVTFYFGHRIDYVLESQGSRWGRRAMWTSSTFRSSSCSASCL